jgi:enamine deaminase RidA (YjgF/YER057c/UK114 family)
MAGIRAVYSFPAPISLASVYAIDIGEKMSQPEFFITPGYGKIGNRVETSGQGGWNDDLQFPESLEDEIAQAFRNVERTLATAGASWAHVVHVNSYHVGGFPPEVNETMARLYRQYMPNHAPIWTELGVEALGHPAMRIEIRVTAIIP